MNKLKVDFNKPYIAKNELRYLKDAIKSDHISGDGVYTKKCHQLLENILAVKKVLLTTSCTLYQGMLWDEAHQS